jgi:hypothetical protein
LGFAGGWIAYATEATTPEVIMGTALASSLHVVVAVSLWLPPRDEVPWWAWLAGVTGVGLGAWGVLAIADHGRCTERFRSGECRVEVQSADAGLLLLGTAMPLLEVPAYYLLLPRGSSRSAYAYLDQSRGGTVVGLGGSF